MITKSITKLLDEAIIPALALIVAKMVGLFLTATFLNLDFSVKNHDLFFLLPSVHFSSIADYHVAENYSNLIMFTTVALGSLFMLLKAHYFHQSHVSPNMQAKLIRLNLESLITPSYHLYHQAVMWLIFLWMTTAFLLISTFIQNITYPVISVLAFIITANFTWIFAQDVEKEIEISQKA